MITYLKVKNLAIVEEFAIEPGAALNVLTGETGAGKSLLIDSLGFLSGARGSAESVRAGAEKMVAEAVFHVPPDLEPLLEELGLESESADNMLELITRREIAANGRGRVMVNGSVLPVRDLNSLMERILEIHGQNESHERLAGKSYREVLDEYAGTASLLSETRAAFDAWKIVARELEEMVEANRELSLKLDLLKYQIEELRAAKLNVEEEESLRNEKSILANARELADSTAGAFALLEDDEAAAISQVARAEHLLQPLSGSIEELRRLLEELADARFRLEEIARSVARLADTVRHDPARLEEIEERLVLVDRMKKKYGGSVEAALEHFAASSQEYERLVNYESNLERLQKEEERAFASYRRSAESLSSKRRDAAGELQSSIQRELADLAMEGTGVRVVVGSAPDADSRLRVGDRGVLFGPDGFDQVQVLVAPNRGEEPKPMQRIASGGELSRIQLGIAAALFMKSDRRAAATLVFDEIDAGIGGRVAEAVGRKLRQLAANNQVICVTHLPQIASLGTTHFRVWKEEVAGRTRACIERLDRREERVEEIARMLGGEKVSDSARLHAADLLDRAAQEEPRKRGASRAVSRQR